MTMQVDLKNLTICALREVDGIEQLKNRLELGDLVDCDELTTAVQDCDLGQADMALKAMYDLVLGLCAGKTTIEAVTKTFFGGKELPKEAFYNDLVKFS